MLSDPVSRTGTAGDMISGHWLMVISQYHNEGVLKKYAPKLKVGTVKEEAKL